MPELAASLDSVRNSYREKDITHEIDVFKALINSIGVAWGDEVTKRTQNSFSNISLGKFALDMYTA